MTITDGSSFLRWTNNLHVIQIHIKKLSFLHLQGCDARLLQASGNYSAYTLTTFQHHIHDARGSKDIRVSVLLKLSLE